MFIIKLRGGDTLFNFVSCVRSLSSQSPGVVTFRVPSFFDFIFQPMQPHICPSILSCDFSALRDECRKVIAAGADWIHVDVMDGHFVPNLTLGAPVITCLHKAIPDAFLDVHLMVEHPEVYVEAMAEAGASQFTFHIEACEEPKKLIDAIHKAGMKASISIKPKTPVEAIFPYLDEVDMILVMTVEPGFGCQSLIYDTLDKVKAIRGKKPELNIQVDGGLNPGTIDSATSAGANCIVSGAIFRTDDPAGLINLFRKSVENRGKSQ